MVRKLILKPFFPVIFLGLILSLNPLGAQQIKIDASPSSENTFKEVIANESGRYAAALDNNQGAIHIIDLFSATQVWKYQGSGYIRNLFFLNDSNIILLGASKIQILDIAKHKITSEYDSPYYIQDADYSSLSKTLALYSQNNIVLLHCESNAINQISSHAIKGIEQFKISADGQHLAYYSQKTISVVSLQDFKVTKRINAENIEAFDLGNDYLVFIYRTPFSYRLFDINGTPISQNISFHSFLKTNVSTVSAMDFGFLLQGYKSLVFVGKEGLQTIIKTNDYFYGAQIIKNIGKTLLWNPYGLSLIDIEGNTFTQFPASQITPTESIYNTFSTKYIFLSDTQIAFSKSQMPGAWISSHTASYCKALSISKFILLGFTDGTLQVWDTETEKKIASQSLAFSPTAVDIDPITGFIYFNNYNDNSIYFWDYIKNTLTFVFQDTFPVTALSAKNNQLYIGNIHGDISIVEENTFVHRFNSLLYGGISCLKHLDSGVMISSYGRFLILPENLADSAKMELYTGHNGYINHFCSTKNQKLFFTCSDDKNIKLWERKNQRLLESYSLDSISAKRMELENDNILHFQGFNFTSGTLADSFLQRSESLKKGEIVVQSPNNNKPLKLAVNHDGNLLAAVDNNTVKVRDLKSGFLISEFATDNHIINGITFTTDGKMLAVAAGQYVQCFDPITGKTIRIIDLSKTGYPGTLGGSPTFLGRSIHDVEAYNNVLVAIHHFNWHNPIILHKNSGLKLDEIYFNLSDEKDNQITDFSCNQDGSLFFTYGSHYVKAFSNGTPRVQLWAVPREGIDLTNKSYFDFMNLSPDAKHLLFVDFDPHFRVKIVDVASGKVIQNHSGGIGAIGKNGIYIHSLAKDQLIMRNIFSDTIVELDVQFDSEINAVVYNEKSDVFVVSDIWGNIKILEGRSGRLVNEISRWDQYTYSSKISESGSFMLINNRSGLYTINLNTLKRELIPGNNYPLSAVFSPINNLLFFRKESVFYSKNLLTGKIDSLFQSSIPPKNFENIAISSDGKILYYTSSDETVFFYDLKLHRHLPSVNRFKIPGIDGLVIRDVVTADNEILLKGVGIKTYGDSSGMRHITCTLGEPWKINQLSQEYLYERLGKTGFEALKFKRDAKVFVLSPSGNFLAFMQNYRLYVINNHSGDTLLNRDNPINSEIEDIVFNETDNLFIVGFSDGWFEVYDLANKATTIDGTIPVSGLAMLYRVQANKMGIESLDFGTGKLIVKGKNAFVSIFDARNGFAKQLDMDFIKDQDQIYITPSGYYYATKNALNYIAYKQDLDIYPLGQIDLIFNRPDEVLKAVNSSDTQLYQSFYAAYKKRVQQSIFKPNLSLTTLKAPVTRIKNLGEIPVYVSTEKIALNIEVSDARTPLRKLDVWINGVPVFGSTGIVLTRNSVFQLDTSLTLMLSEGRNFIEIGTTNSLGIESFKTSLAVSFTALKPSISKVYFIGIGIDNFADSSNNLNYSCKDIRDLNAQLQHKFGNNLISHTLYNQDVSIQNILALKSILLNTNVNDKVIIAYSGHGLLGSNYDYYLSTYTVNFLKPEKNGLPYKLFENLLDSIPARKKLMLIDACHSGEIDRSGAILLQAVGDSMGLIKGSKIRNTNATPRLGLTNSFELMQDLFISIGKSTGSVIISASAGTQFALEKGNLKNGVFTYTILEAMNSKTNLKVSELKTYVGKRVEEITNGMQKPTSRNETLTNDWIVW